MIDAVRTTALDYLAGELTGEELPADLENWYQNLCRNSPGKIETVYIWKNVRMIWYSFRYWTLWMTPVEPGRDMHTR